MAKKQFKTESKRILDLMINSIYTHKEIFLRELISNASDAIDKLCYLSLTDDRESIDRSEFRITIKANKEGRLLTISDNGIGMSEKELEQNLGVIAESGSLQFKKELAQAENGEDKGDAGKEIDIIGQFGVGFYSAFMVAKKVAVITRKYGEESGSCWVSTGADGYTITSCEKEKPGTDVVIELKDDTEEEKYTEYLEKDTISFLVKKYSDYIRWPIVMEDETLNSMVPIWQRAKSEVSDEDCAKFYKDTFFDYTDPLSVIRVSAEGLISYKAMLFIPGRAPADYYTTSFKPGLKLYSSGVMIMDRCADLVPEHFRFVQGVVDSQDLSLNISREILQHNRQLSIISANIEKKIKNELERLQANEPEKYDTFFNNFGLQIKYGVIAEYGAKKEFLQDLLMFWSEKKEKLVSLKEYVEAMPEDQKYIYYACGESKSVISGFPQLDKIKERGYDVLYMTENVDEFVATMIDTYMDKKLKSIHDDDLGLESAEEKEQAQKAAEENKSLLDFAVETLDGKISECRIAHNLKSAPACLTAKGAVSLEMERHFNSIPSPEGQAVKAERVLELNKDHPVFAAFKEAYCTDKEKAAKYVKILYFQSLMIAGLPIGDPSEFSALISELMI